MQLPEFIAKALSFFTSADQRLEKIADQSSRIAALEKDVVAQLDENKRISAALETALATIEAQKKEMEATDLRHSEAIKAKESEVAKRAEAKAGEIAASQGVPPVKSETVGTTSGQSLDWMKQYAQEPDPLRRAELWLANRKN